MSAIPTAGSNVTNISALQQWGHAVEQAIALGGAAGTYAKAREIGVPLSGPLGRWISEVSHAADAGGTCAFNLFSYLRNAQVQISSPFGRWASKISQQMKTCIS